LKEADLPKKYAEESVLVCSRAKLELLIHGVGVIPSCNELWAEISNAFPMKRGIAEENTDVVQLVSYFVVLNNNKLLTHKRSKRQPEKRLVNIKSVGFSGHIMESDADKLYNFDMFEPSLITPYINRELAEEVKVKLNPDFPISFVGYIWEPSDALGKQHLGLMYIVPCDGSFTIMEPGLLTQARFESMVDINSTIDNYTTWSRMVINYLNNNKNKLGNDI